MSDWNTASAQGWTPWGYDECEAFVALRSAISQRQRSIEQIPNFPEGRNSFPRRMRRVLHAYNTPDTWLPDVEFPVGTKNAVITEADKVYRWVSDRLLKDKTFVTQVCGDFSNVPGRKRTPFTLRSGNKWIVHSCVDLRNVALVLRERSRGLFVIANKKQVKTFVGDMITPIFPEYSIVLTSGAMLRKKGSI